jgi:hypothetical protein
MPRARLASGNTAAKPAVLHQTIEIPQNDQQQTQTPEKRVDFWTYMRQLTPEQWKDHIVYLTRESPKTTINGLGGYLTKMCEPFDIDDIKTGFGGREFSYIMKNKNEIVYSGRFSVEAPPRLDREREMPTVSGGPAGMGSDFGQQFISVLRDELARSRESGDGDAKVIEMLTKASDRAVEMVTRQLPNNDPAKQLESLLNVAKAMGILGNANGNGGALKELLSLLTPFAPILTPLLQKLLNPPDPLAQINTYLGLFEKLDALRGEGSGSGRRRDWKEIAAEKALEIAPRILDDMAARRQAAAAPAPAPAYRTIPSASPQGASSPQLAPQGATVPPAAPAPRSNEPLRTVPLNGEVVEAAPAPVPASFETQPEFVDWLKRRIVVLVEMGQSGESIVDFLDGAAPGFSDQLAQAPADQVTAFLAIDPILSAVTKHPRWAQTLEEARAYILDEEPEPVGVPKVQ